MPDPIKVLIVEDSPTVSRILVALIDSDPALKVVGTATDGAEAIRLTSRLRPNIITMDVNMPRMTGLEATEYIMAHQPTPILVLTAFSKQDVNLSFKMLSAGALDLIEKPDADDWKSRRTHLLERLKLLSRIKVITHVRGKGRAFKEAVEKEAAEKEALQKEALQKEAAKKETARTGELKPLAAKEKDLRPLWHSERATAPLDPSKIYKPTILRPVRPAGPLVDKLAPPDTPVPTPEPELLKRRFEVLGIAASTGGPPALARLLRDIPPGLPIPLFLVQHIPAGFSMGLAEWLNGETKLAVKLAEEGETPRPGFAYLPADDRHLTFLPDGRLHLDDSPARYSLRPSADLTFESMSKVWPGTTLAVILTGMGRDGSVGMRHLNEVGGYNIAQDETSSVIFGMPKAAIELGVVDKILPLGHIASYLKQILKMAQIV